MSSNELLNSSVKASDIRQNLKVTTKGKLKWKGSFSDLQDLLIRELGIQTETKWSTPGGYCKKFENNDLTIRWYTDSFSLIIKGDDSSLLMDKLGLLATKESETAEENKEEPNRTGEEFEYGTDEEDDTLEQDTGIEKCPSQMSINEKSNDLLNIDSILELIELKVNDIKKEFTSKISDLENKIFDLKTHSTGSLSQEKFIDNLKREKQELKDENCVLSEKVINLSPIK